jgi:hypothetical protein
MPCQVSLYYHRAWPKTTSFQTNDRGRSRQRKHRLFVFLDPFLHLQHYAERHGLGVFGLAVLVEKLAVGVDEIDDDCVVDNVVHVVILGTGRKVDSEIT